jgi:hypothetical protein
MESALTANVVPNVPVQLQRTNDFRRRIIKLRWIGREDEAERLLRSQRHEDRSNYICLGELDTD